ncbi:hypothetical protein EJK53_0574 [Moraxella catarrhalis]|uniref:Uncharacterized protein n=1 Tax=Moraxella catarrhalis TaxID=480 RepID=A0A3S9QC02_MORCA|nr:hypothetical protein EJK53_0574 [Moraxella catarrhalis]
MNKRIKDYFLFTHTQFNQSINKMNTPSLVTNQTLGYFSPI